MDMGQYMLETVVLPQIGGRFSPITVLYISCFCCIEHRYLAPEFMFLMKFIGSISEIYRTSELCCQYNNIYMYFSQVYLYFCICIDHVDSVTVRTVEVVFYWQSVL